MGFPLSCSALGSRKATPWLLARFREFERPEHAPWSPAWTHTFTVVCRRPPCVPRSRERENRPAAGREKFCIPEKKEKENILHIASRHVFAPRPRGRSRRRSARPTGNRPGHTPSRSPPRPRPVARVARPQGRKIGAGFAGCPIPFGRAQQASSKPRQSKKTRGSVDPIHFSWKKMTCPVFEIA